eukprot:scaffold129607_cov28-Tisochrysis_lutea.AAC.3
MRIPNEKGTWFTAGPLPLPSQMRSRSSRSKLQTPSSDAPAVARPSCIASHCPWIAPSVLAGRSSISRSNVSTPPALRSDKEASRAAAVAWYAERKLTASSESSDPAMKISLRGTPLSRRAFAKPLWFPASGLVKKERNPASIAWSVNRRAASSS